MRHDCPGGAAAPGARGLASDQTDSVTAAEDQMLAMLARASRDLPRPLRATAVQAPEVVAHPVFDEQDALRVTVTCRFVARFDSITQAAAFLEGARSERMQEPSAVSPISSGLAELTEQQAPPLTGWRKALQLFSFLRALPSRPAESHCRDAKIATNLALAGMAHPSLGPSSTAATTITSASSAVADLAGDGSPREEAVQTQWSFRRVVSRDPDFEIPVDELELMERIAVGGFSEVFKARYQGAVVAVKRIFTHELDTDVEQSERLLDAFRNEVRTLRRLRHPNLCLYMGFCGKQPHLLIVMEFCARGSLFGELRRLESKRELPAKVWRRAVALGVARGLQYLHSRSPPIVHCDIKSSNILLDNSRRPKLADFNLATAVSSLATVGGVTTAAAGGTPQYQAPEAMLGHAQLAHTTGTDVYSFGVVLWELLTGRVPWAGRSQAQVVAAVAFRGENLMDSYVEQHDAELEGLARACLHKDPSERPSASDLVHAIGQMGPG